jgi:hypothetical protein
MLLRDASVQNTCALTAQMPKLCAGAVCTGSCSCRPPYKNTCSADALLCRQPPKFVVTTSVCVCVFVLLLQRG